MSLLEISFTDAERAVGFLFSTLERLNYQLIHFDKSQPLGVYPEFHLAYAASQFGRPSSLDMVGAFCSRYSNSGLKLIASRTKPLAIMKHGKEKIIEPTACGLLCEVWKRLFDAWENAGFGSAYAKASSIFIICYRYGSFYRDKNRLQHFHALDYRDKIGMAMKAAGWISDDYNEPTTTEDHQFCKEIKDAKDKLIYPFGTSLNDLINRTKYAMRFNLQRLKSLVVSELASFKAKEIPVTPTTNIAIAKGRKAPAVLEWEQNLLRSWQGFQKTQPRRASFVTFLAEMKLKDPSILKDPSNPRAINSPRTMENKIKAIQRYNQRKSRG